MRKLFLAPLILLVCFSLLSFWKPAKATSATISIFPSEDTIISAYFPNSQVWSNYTDLQIGNDTSIPETKIAYLKFDFSEIPAGATITACEINVYCKTIDYYSTYYAYYSIQGLTSFANETWDSDTITWNNAPTRNSGLSLEEAYLIIASAPEYKTISFDKEGNETYGLESIEYAYNNSLTKTYTLEMVVRYGSATTFISTYYSEDSSIYRPYLYITYDLASISETSEEISSAPELENPKIYDLIFNVDSDTVIKSGYGNLNYGTLNKSSIAYSSSFHDDFLLKFNLSFPDYIDGEPNIVYSLYGQAFDILELRFYQYCYQAPPFALPQWPTGANILHGIFRSNESWLENSVTYNTKPVYRPSAISLSQMIETGEQWYNYDFSTEEDYIRYSIQQNYTYSIVHKVDQTEGTARNYWRMREYNATISYVWMRVAIENLDSPIPDYLTFVSAPAYFGLALGITPFIAGHLLTLIFTFVILLGVIYITRNQYVILISSFGLLTIFMVFGWLNMGVYLILILTTVLLMGGVFKKWL